VPLFHQESRLFEAGSRIQALQSRLAEQPAKKPRMTISDYGNYASVLATWVLQDVQLESESVLVCVPGSVADDHPTIRSGTEVVLFENNIYNACVNSTRVVAAVLFDPARPSRLCIQWREGTLLPTWVEAVNTDVRFAVPDVWDTPAFGTSFNYAVSSDDELEATQKTRKEEALERQRNLQAHLAQKSVEILNEAVIEASSKPFVAKESFRKRWPDVFGSPRIFHVEGSALDDMSDLVPQLELACDNQMAWTYQIHKGEGVDLTPLRTLQVPACPTKHSKCMVLSWGHNGVHAFRKFLVILVCHASCVFVFVITSPIMRNGTKVGCFHPIPVTPFPLQVESALEQLGIVPVKEWSFERMGGNNYTSHTLLLEDGSKMTCTTTVIKAEVGATDQLLHRDSTRVASRIGAGQKAVYFNIIYPMGAARQFTSFQGPEQPHTPAHAADPSTFLVFDGLQPHYGNGHNGGSTEPEYRFFAGMCWRGDEANIEDSVDFVDKTPVLKDGAWHL
jgi:hypothetical protein